MQSLNSFLFGEETCFTIHGYPQCPYYQKAVQLGKHIDSNNKNIKVENKECDREEWKEYLEKQTIGLGHKARYHTTCPLVIEGCTDDSKSFVGGYAEFLNHSKKNKFIKPKN
ncbi:hypothetical protein ACTFIZ_000428 [Dictyostelium cf. discoideum]